VTADLAYNDRRADGIGRVAATSIPAYEAQLPDDVPARVVTQPSDVERFAAAFFRWDGGSNYTDMPEVKVQRRVGSRWEDYAGQQGELPVTMKFPEAGELPAYRAGQFHFQWTAHFEAFVASFALGDRPRATPPGSYRFVVDGKHRRGGKVTGYHLASRTFRVSPWSGIQVLDLRSANGVVSFRVGPRHVLAVPGSPPLTTEIGPIDFPDSYSSSLKARYIDPRRWAFRDPDAPTDPTKVAWYCRPNPDPPDNEAAIKKHGCSFRPWLDAGNANRAVVTFVRPGGAVRKVSARLVGGRWVAAGKLAAGEAAFVASGDVCDRWNDYNGAASRAIGAGGFGGGGARRATCVAKTGSSGGGNPGGGGGNPGGGNGGGNPGGGGDDGDDDGTGGGRDDGEDLRSTFAVVTAGAAR
jgi:hypothetical protein